MIGQFANVQSIDVRQHGTVSATVATTTLAPTADIANSTSPFVLFSEAIVDQSGTLKTINNAGAITALNTQLSPGVNAVVVNTARAIDLQASTADGIVINNSGVIQGDVLFGTAGNNDVFNVGNIGTGGTVNPATGLLNTPNTYAVVAASASTVVTGATPITTANLISFGSGSGQQLNVVAPSVTSTA